MFTERRILQIQQTVNNSLIIYYICMLVYNLYDISFLGIQKTAVCSNLSPIRNCYILVVKTKILF